MALLPATGIPLNCGTISGTGVPTYTYNKPLIGGDAFVVDFVTFDRILVPGTETPVIDKDTILTQSSSTVTITDVECNVIPGVEFYDPDTLVASSNSGVILGTAGYNGVASGVSAGTATLHAFDANDRDNNFKSFAATVENESGATVEFFSKNFVNPSLARTIASGLQPYVDSAYNPTLQKPIFSSYNHSTATYTRNPNIWTSGIDLTCISPWNSNAGQNKCGTLISPRHFIYAQHYAYPNGTTVRFVDNSNNVVDRTVVSQQQVGLSDARVGLLNSDVPSGISFAKIFPTGWIYKIPAMYMQPRVDEGNLIAYQIPAIHTDQQNKILCANVARFDAGQTSVGASLPLIQEYPDRNALAETVVVGDSGSSCHFVVNNELVILTSWFRVYNGPFYGYYNPTINAVMNSLGGGYSLTEIDLSSFPDFP